MIRYVTYHRETGEIVDTGHLPEELLQEGVPDEHKRVAGHASRNDHYVDLATGAIAAKTRHPARPVITCGKVGQEWRMRNVVAGSKVVVRAPSGAIVASLTPDGDGVVRYTPAEPGKHLIGVAHKAHHPETWHLDVLA